MAQLSLVFCRYCNNELYVHCRIKLKNPPYRSSSSLSKASSNMTSRMVLSGLSIKTCKSLLQLLCSKEFVLPLRFSLITFERLNSTGFPLLGSKLCFNFYIISKICPVVADASICSESRSACRIASNNSSAAFFIRINKLFKEAVFKGCNFCSLLQNAYLSLSVR